MALNLFSRTEGKAGQGADWRAAVDNVKTEPPAGLLQSVIQRFPIDTAVKSAARAKDRVTSANGDLIKAEIALEQVRKDNAERERECAAYVEKKLTALRKSEVEYDAAQVRVLTEAKEAGAIDGKFVDFKLMQKTPDDDVVPTVRLDNV